MLETKSLVKTYKPKKGIPVKALDGVSIKFPEKGMVFLLGKSGCGKSTLLNLLGGLDKYDEGEIIIKGVSSKDFKQQHFDSYRNTYVGFIFQEYNILDEFSVGQNIALALQLQGKKPSDEEINKILSEVDLAGFGSRKPNELSGGQKQRVAIARALVKNPKIIMADEPTGALDSATGRQVLDTLKKLSEDKLVIVVSHDREFAEKYADRIIELSDGKVISDKEYLSEYVSDDKMNFSDGAVFVPPMYHITEKDLEEINKYIDSLGDDGCRIIPASKFAKRKSVDTDVSKITGEDGSTFKLIKSKLPMKNAVKIGASGLKYKKFRLFMTVVLSVVAFTLFGLMDTFASYEHIKNCAQSILDTGITFATFRKEKKNTVEKTEYRDEYYYFSDTLIGFDELDKIKEKTGVEVNGVLNPFINDYRGSGLYFGNQIKYPDDAKSVSDLLDPDSLNGLTEVDDKLLEELGYKLMCGKLPENANEILLSEYSASAFIGNTFLEISDENPEKLTEYKIRAYGDLVGKKLVFENLTFTVSGIVNTGFDRQRYEEAVNNMRKDDASTAEMLIGQAYLMELEDIFSNSFANLGMLKKGSIGLLVEEIKAKTPIFIQNNKYFGVSAENVDKEMYAYFDFSTLAKLSDVNKSKIIWTDGEKTSLGKGEYIITSDFLNEIGINPVNIYEENGNICYEYSDEDILKMKDIFKSFTYYPYAQNGSLGDCKIAGVITEFPADSRGCIIPDEMYEELGVGNVGFDFAIGYMPKTASKIEAALVGGYDDNADERYTMCNQVVFELDTVNEIFEELKTVFLYIGIGFAVFASLMLSNFIGQSISYKKQDIGILRAIGSRGNDVFRIFFSESFIIAMINFVISSVAVFAVTVFINNMVRSRGLLITVVTMGIRQFALLFAISVLAAFAASYIPVKRIANKRPIDAIKSIN